MTLPPRIPKPKKRSTRWRSQAHEKFVKGFACSNCGFMPSDGLNIGAHVRLGAHAGLSQKPDDWRIVSLCAKCHQLQHDTGEDTFWRTIARRDPEALIDAFCRASPKRFEIEQVKRERAEG